MNQPEDPKPKEVTPWWQKHTAESLGETREQPESAAAEMENPAQTSPAPPIAVESPADRPADAVTQPEWHVEPTSPPPAPVFAESASVLPVPEALPAEEPRFDEEPFEEEDGAEELEGPEGMEASEAEPEEKEGDRKSVV